MMTLSQLTEILGWAAVINIGILFFSSLALAFMRPFITAIHSKMFGIAASELSISYFNYLAHYKVLLLVFVVSPYLALKILGY